MTNSDNLGFRSNANHLQIIIPYGGNSTGYVCSMTQSIHKYAGRFARLRIIAQGMKIGIQIIVAAVDPLI